MSFKNENLLKKLFWCFDFSRAQTYVISQFVPLNQKIGGLWQKSLNKKTVHEVKLPHESFLFGVLTSIEPKRGTKSQFVPLPFTYLTVGLSNHHLQIKSKITNINSVVKNCHPSWTRIKLILLAKNIVTTVHPNAIKSARVIHLRKYRFICHPPFDHKVLIITINLGNYTS